MAIDFGSVLNKAKEMSTSKKKGYEKDERFITITRDSDDKGSLVLRFLPDKGALLPSVSKFSHFGKKEVSKDDVRWFVAECPTTIDEKCPYCETYLEAWKYKDTEKTEELKGGKRKEEYISNVLVIKDPGNPENEGKVMLYKYGWAIQKMIDTALEGEEEAEVDPINIYDPINGANFLLKHSRQGKNIVLEGSKFLNPSSIVEEDESAIEELIEKTYDLTEYLNSLTYETYDELKKKFYKFENGVYPDETSETKSGTPKKEVPKKETPKKEEKVPEKPKESSTESVVKDDELDDFFNNL
mgnify:CR=1 FL=1